MADAHLTNANKVVRLPVTWRKPGADTTSATPPSSAALKDSKSSNQTPATVEFESDSVRIELTGYLITCVDYFNQLKGLGYEFTDVGRRMAELEAEIKVFNATYPPTHRGKRIRNHVILASQEDELVALERRARGLSLEIRYAAELALRVQTARERVVELDVMYHKLGARSLFTTRARENSPGVQRVIAFAANPEPEIRWLESIAQKARDAIEASRFDEVETILSGFTGMEELHDAVRHEYREFFEVIVGGKNSSDQTTASSKGASQ